MKRGKRSRVIEGTQGKYMEEKKSVQDAVSSIYATKSEFEKSFTEGLFYNKQTQDEEHLKLIIEALPIKPGMKILDLGTGSGYLSFPLAETYPNVEITGLDIVEKALQMNREKAVEAQLENLEFVAYDGIEFPFADGTFDLIVTRYALHHFPIIEKTFSEIGRVLSETGVLFISDPAPNDNDTERFVDAYMQMKKDGHIKFYTMQEWKDLAGNAGFELEQHFETAVRFPKKRSTALELEDILQRHDADVIKGYDLAYIGDEIYVTEKVNNLLFVRTI